MKQQEAKHTIRRNTLLSLLISGISYLYPVLVFAYIARILHPEGLGRLSFATSVTACFAMFTGLGMQIYGLRASAENQRREEKARLMAELLIIRLLSGLVAWGIFLFAEHFFQSGSGEDHRLLMICGFSILATIPDCSWFYKGMEDYRTLAWTSAVGRICGLAVILLLVRSASDLPVYAWISVLMPMILSVAELILADRKWHLHLWKQLGDLIRSGRVFRSIQKHIRPLMLFMLMSCAVTIYTHTDTVMLGLMRGKQVVGLYTCAAKIKGLLPILTGALWAAALPKSAELWRNRDEEGFRSLADKSFHVIYMVMLPLTVYFFLFAEPWTMLIGGGEYLEAAGSMRLLLAAVIPIGFSNIIGGQMLIPMGEEKKLFYAEAIGAGSNILINALLIPVLSSAGAAIATTVSEILVTVFAMRFALKMVRFRILQPGNLLHSLVGCCAAGLLTAGMARLFRLSPSVMGPLSFVIYLMIFTSIMLLFRDSLYRDMIRSARKLCRRVLPEAVRIPIGRIIQIIRAMYYRGQMVFFSNRLPLYCPCCETRLRSFVEGGYLESPELYDGARYVGIRQDIICPVCGSLPRHRILAEWCAAHRDELRTADILYFAPEYSMMRWMKKNGIACTTADLYAKADLKLDIQKTGLPDESRDFIFCNHVLEHVDDYQKALAEMRRILRPEGRLICSFPMDPETDLVDEETERLTQEERIRRFGQHDHRRVFGMHADQLLTEAGFRVEPISGEAYPENILPVVGPGNYDLNRLFDCRKTSKGEIHHVA